MKKGIIKWAVCFGLNKKCLEDDEICKDKFGNIK